MVIALRYRRYFGAWLIAAGIGLNLIPMIAHGGLMPISYDVIHKSGAFPEITRANIGQQLSNGKDIVLNSSDITFPWLADRYIVTLPGYGTNIYSLGDFVLFGGIALVVVQLIAAPFWFSFSASKSRPAGPGPDDPESSSS